MVVVAVLILVAVVLEVDAPVLVLSEDIVNQGDVCVGGKQDAQGC